jgi:hypothetical protein
MIKPQSLSVDLPRIDGNTKSRLAINEDVVQDYADMITEANGEWPFPPIDVFFDGTEHFVADGFHRFLAAHRAKRGSIPSIVHAGTATDAKIFGMTANDKHGLRMTKADKRACVDWLLDNGGKMTQVDIAEKAGVCRRLVQSIVADRKPKFTPPPPTAKKAQNALLQPEEGQSDDSHPSSPPEPDSEPADAPTERDSKAQNAPCQPGEGESDAEPALCPKCGSTLFDDGTCRACLPADAPDAARSTPDGPKPDYGKCPNCLGTKWTEDDDGVACAKCCHPYGEPAGDVDDDRLTTQRQKTIKTIEALMRAFDDLQAMSARKEHAEAITGCKRLLSIAKGWK